MVYFRNMLIKDGKSLLIEKSNLEIESEMVKNLMDDIQITRGDKLTKYTMKIHYKYIQDKLFSEGQQFGFSMMVSDGEYEATKGKFILNIQDNNSTKDLTPIDMVHKFSVTAYIEKPLDTLDTYEKNILTINNYSLILKDGEIYFNDSKLSTMGETGLFVCINYDGQNHNDKNLTIITYSIGAKKFLKVDDVKQNTYNVPLYSHYKKINISINKCVKDLQVTEYLMNFDPTTDTWATNKSIKDAGQTGWMGYFTEALLYPSTAKKAGTIEFIKDSSSHTSGSSSNSSSGASSPVNLPDSDSNKITIPALINFVGESKFDKLFKDSTFNGAKRLVEELGITFQEFQQSKEKEYQIQIKIIPGGHMDYYTKDTIILRYDIINERGYNNFPDLPFNVESEKRITLKILIDSENKNKKMVLKQTKKTRSHSGWKNTWKYENKYNSLQEYIFFNNKYFIVKTQGEILRANKFGSFYTISDLNMSKTYFIDGELSYKETCNFLENTKPILFKYITVDKKTFFKLFELNDEIFKNLQLI
jgi:hypothetical protein